MKRLDLLDYARFAAALCVAAFHYLFNGIANGKIAGIAHVPELIALAKYGYLGVEFFFIISGYVIFFSAQNRSASEFVVSRALRLYPAFWFAVVLTSLFAFCLAQGGSMAVHPKQILANLTMMAPLFHKEFVDGVYWTLVYELTFYALIFALLLGGFANYLKKIFLLWPLVILLVGPTRYSYLPLMGGYYSYFAAGVVLAIMKSARTWPVILSLLIAIADCILYSTGKGLRMVAGTEFSPTVVAAVIVLFFAFFIFLNSARASMIKLPNAKLIGGLTYPLYLVHAHIGYMLISRFASEQNKLFVTGAVLCLMLMFAYLIHTIVEIRFAVFWKTLFQRTIGDFISYVDKKLTPLKQA